MVPFSICPSSLRSGGPDSTTTGGYYSAISDKDGGTDRVDGFIRRIVGAAELLSDLPDGEFQFEELEETVRR
jgi:hypothetical protein